MPTERPGATLVRFWVDFPESASRNDVILPATRVFFSCVVLEGEASTVEDAAEELPPHDILEGAGGERLLITRGGITIKRNDVRNLFGMLGDVNLILGRCSISALEQGSE